MLDVLSHIVIGIVDVFVSAWEVYLLLAPYFVFGLAFAGILYVMISQAAILRMMGKEGLGSVMTAAAFGLPLPICSCGVIPITATLRQKGASRSACMSFLITTPETGMDSILVTSGLMGPLMAVVRPVAAFFSAILAGVLSIGLLRDEPEKAVEHHHDHDHDHHHHHDHSHGFEDDPAVVGPAGLARSIKAAFIINWIRLINWTRMTGWNRPVLKPSQEQEIPEFKDAVPLRVVGKRVFTFTCVEMADDILLALLVGIFLTGVLMVFVPDDLAHYGISGFNAYLLMLLAGVPLYMCASASTPIAAALVLKGISPGAALVFLMTGPATNTATIVVLMKQFGFRFVSIYIGSIVVGAVLSGLALDGLLLVLGWEIAISLSSGQSGIGSFLEWTGAGLLTALIVWRFWKGHAMSGYHDLIGNLRDVFIRISGLAKGSKTSQIFSLRSRIVAIGGPVILIAYLISGFTAVPPGHLGYGKAFDAVLWRDLQPGLHYAPPWPFGTVEIRPHKLHQRLVVGIEGDTSDVIASYLGLTGTATPSLLDENNQALSSNLVEFLTGDENLMRILVSVHFAIEDPFLFYYRMRDAVDFITHGVQASAREFIAANRLDGLTSTERSELEHYILFDIVEHVGAETHEAEPGADEGHSDEHHADFDMRFEKMHDSNISIGVSIKGVHVLTVHPAQETMAAFRDLASANQDRETAILEAERLFTLLVPRAAGNAAIEIQRSSAIAEGKLTRAMAESDSFVAKAKAISNARSVLTDALWFETSERAYHGRELFVLPSNAGSQNLNLWTRRSGGSHESDKDGSDEKGDH